MNDETMNDEQTPEETPEEVLATARALLLKNDLPSRYLDREIFDVALKAIEADPGIGFEVLAKFEKEMDDAKGEIYKALVGSDQPQSARSIMEAQGTQQRLDVTLPMLAAVLNTGADAAHVHQHVDAPLNGEHLAVGFQEVEDEDIRVDAVALNAQDYADLRKFGRDILEAESREPFLKQGLMGNLWGAHVITSRVVPAGTVLVIGEVPRLFPDGLDQPMHAGGLVAIHVNRTSTPG